MVQYRADRGKLFHGDMRGIMLYAGILMFYFEHYQLWIKRINVFLIILDLYTLSNH